MRKTLSVTLLASAAFALTPPDGADAQARSWSDPTGFHVGVNVAGAGITYDSDTQTDSGPGVGVTLGWGFINLITAYVEMTASTMDGLNVSGDTYDMVNFDIGARFNFLDKGKKFRPYALVALSGIGAERDIAGRVPVISGGGLTVGGGLAYFFSRKISADVGLKFSSVTFTQSELAGATTTIPDLPATATRFTLGMNYWHGYR